jgi:hypothetical protein
MMSVSKSRSRTAAQRAPSGASGRKSIGLKTLAGKSVCFHECPRGGKRVSSVELSPAPGGRVLPTWPELGEDPAQHRSLLGDILNRRGTGVPPVGSGRDTARCSAKFRTPYVPQSPLELRCAKTLRFQATGAEKSRQDPTVEAARLVPAESIHGSARLPIEENQCLFWSSNPVNH